MSQTNDDSSAGALLEIKETKQIELKVEDIIISETFFDKALKVNYLIGVKFKRRLKRIYRKIKKKALLFINKINSNIKKAVNRLKKNLLDGLTEFVLIFKRANNKYKQNKSDVLNERKKGIVSNVILASFVVQEVLKFIFRFLLVILNYVAPVAAVALLIVTIKHYQELNYGVEVMLNGEIIGRVRDESVYKIAEQDMQERIYLEGEDPLYTTPTFSIAVVSEDELLSAKQLTESIIMASGNDISRASGLYIDNGFYGATTDGELLQDTISNILHSYKTGELDEEISFLQNIEVKRDSLYINKSIRDLNDLTKVFSDKIQAQEPYMVEKGDDTETIAGKYNVTNEELLLLNPGIEENLISGQEIMVNYTQPFISIKKTVTEITQEEIDYQVERIENKSKPIGYANVSVEGEDGLAEIYHQVSFVDGVRADSVEINRVTLKEPINEQIVLGTRDSRTGTNVSLEELEEVQASGVFTWPVQSGGKITNGWLGYRGHYALDIQSFKGDGTLAADDGVVVQVTYSNVGYGYHVIIDHLNGYRTLYAHNNEIVVKVGQTVKRGEVIAKQGRTGRVYGRTGIHLHFEIHKNGVAVDPSGYLVR